MIKKIIMFIIIMIHIIKVTSLNIVSINPGGLLGFYQFGICKYIKENYNLTNTKFYGSSAGSWNSLYLSKKHDNDNLFYDMILDINNYKYKNLYDIQTKLKTNILNTFNEDDFNLNSLNVCTTQFKKFKFKKKIFSNFDNLNETIDCCIASSHLPILTNGKLFYKYKKNLYLDGGFFKYPTPLGIKSDLIITPNMWNNKEMYDYNNINNLNIRKLIQLGYNDAKDNLIF